MMEDEEYTDSSSDGGCDLIIAEPPIPMGEDEVMQIRYVHEYSEGQFVGQYCLVDFNFCCTILCLIFLGHRKLAEVAEVLGKTQLSD